MKKILSVFIMMCILVFILPNRLEATEVDSIFVNVGVETEIICEFKIISDIEGNKTAQVGNGSNSAISTDTIGQIKIPKTITDEEGRDYTVTSIGILAFYGCSGLTSIEIPSSVISIGEWAFSGCIGLTSIEIPSSVISIEYGAFNGCRGLTSIEIPASVISIKYGTFFGCSGLTTIEMPQVTSIGEEAFYGCSGLTNIEMPQVISIREGAFFGCIGLTNIEIPSSVTSIGEWAFSGCSNLKEIIFLREVAPEIQSQTFSNISSEAIFYIPASVQSYESIYWQNLQYNKIPVQINLDKTSITLDTNIDPKTKKLTAEILPQDLSNKTITWSSSDESVATVDQEGNVTAVGKGTATITAKTYYGFTATCDVIVTTKVEKIELNKTSISLYTNINETEKLIATISPTNATNKNIVWSSSDESVATVDQEGKVVAVGDGTATITVKTEDGGFEDTCEVTVKSDIFTARIKNGEGEVECTFKILSLPHGGKPGTVQVGDSDYLTSTISLDTTGHIEIPDTIKDSEGMDYTVTSIGDSAFYQCESLENITILEGVTSIGNGAFSGCSGLTSIEIPSSVISIGEEAFFGCSGLTNIEMPQVTSIGSLAFYGCIGLTNIEMPQVTSIESLAFYGCIGLTNIEMPQVISIREGAFYGCSSLTSITIPEGVTSIGDSAFSGCSNLKEIIFLPIESPQVQNNTFKNISEEAIFYIPSNGTGYDKGYWADLQYNKIPVQINLDKTSITLDTNIDPKTKKLTAEILPQDLSNKTITWSSSDESVATVDQEGNVTAVGKGTATITAKTYYGFTATCDVTVTEYIETPEVPEIPEVPEVPQTPQVDNTDTAEEKPNITIISPTKDNPSAPTEGQIEIKEKPNKYGQLTIDINNKTITEAFEKAYKDADKKGNIENGINIVIKIDTNNKNTETIKIELPKEVQETIIEKEIKNTIVILENPNIKIDLDLKTIIEINKTAKTDITITATKIDNNTLSQEIKNIVETRPAFNFEVNYGKDKQVKEFGDGNISISIPYTIKENEKAENIKAIYIDENGKIEWMENSTYNLEKKAVEFKTNHFSVYAVAYRQEIKEQVKKEFIDIKNHWAKENIEYIVNLGLFTGTSENTFSPDNNMTRGMFVTVLGRLENIDTNKYTKTIFTDINKTSYYMPYIQWATENNLVKGTGENKFSPEDPITREQMAVILNNYINLKNIEITETTETKEFADQEKISKWAIEAVKAIKEIGIISGKEGNRFDPQGILTRGEATTVLRRFIEKTK